MTFFVPLFVGPYVNESGYGRLCEIGASYGQSTDLLLQRTNTVIDVIDPCLDMDLVAKYRDQQRIRVHKGTSLEVLPTMAEAFDCILIDGDHNWYTVYNELTTIDRLNLLRPGGTIFLHDVGWPYGRRDLYYRPELIPHEFVHHFAMKGIVHGRSELSETLGRNRQLANAAHEGGPRNGVLTAVEDFVRDSAGGFRHATLREEFGLSVLWKAGDPRSERVFNRYVRKARTRSVKRALRDLAFVAFLPVSPSPALREKRLSLGLRHWPFHPLAKIRRLGKGASKE